MKMAIYNNLKIAKFTLALLSSIALFDTLNADQVGQNSSDPSTEKTIARGPGGGARAGGNPGRKADPGRGLQRTPALSRANVGARDAAAAGAAYGSAAGAAAGGGYAVAPYYSSYGNYIAPPPYGSAFPDNKIERAPYHDPRY